jgi:hypothetical protein
MMLKHKVAVVYGAGGAIGSAVARGFAAEGARLFLTGRHRAPVEAVAKDIVSADGSAEVAEIDVLDEQAVDRYLRYVVGQAGRIDISFDAVGIPGSQILGVPAADLDAEMFALPITTYTTSYFVTARLAARHMIPNRAGVIMTVTAFPARKGTPLNGGYGAAMAAQGGTHPGPVRRARAAGHPGGRPAAERHRGDEHDAGTLRDPRQGIGHDLGAVRGVPRQHDPPPAGHDARGDGQRGGLHGIRQGQRDDGNHRQPDHGDPR